MSIPQNQSFGPAARPTDPYEDEVSLPIGAIVSHWWRKRATLAVLFLTGGIAALLLASGLYLLRPASYQSTLTLRLLFDGVEHGAYPNGERFNPADILATSVLEKVYAHNELKKFIPFEDFKHGLAITVYNPELNRLQRYFQDQLTARALTTVERQKIETEFQEKLASLKNAEFMLVANFGSRFEHWADSLVAKVLSDTINTWVEQSKVRGIFKFDMNIFSGNVLPANSVDDDYLIFVDRLRLSINRVKANVDDLIRIPGADLMRVGPQNVSLGELRASLDDALKYRIGTIDSCIIQYGFYRNKTLARAYLNDQMFRLQLTLDELNAQNKTLQDVQSSYAPKKNGVSYAGAGLTTETSPLSGGSMITQLSDTFIDRVMALSERSSEEAFRQNLANRMIAIQNKNAEVITERRLYLRQLEALGGEVVMKENAAETKQWMERQINDAHAQLKVTLADVQTFHTALSQRNLEPATVYTLTGPVRAESVSPLRVSTLAMLGLVLGASIIGTGLIIVTWRGLQAPAHLTTGAEPAQVQPQENRTKDVPAPHAAPLPEST